MMTKGLTSRKIGALIVALMMTVALCLTAVAMTARGEEPSQSDAYTSSKVLKFTVDLGENYAQAGAKNANRSFAKLQGADRGAAKFAAGDKIIYEVYNPDATGGGFNGQAFTALTEAPWASGYEFFDTTAANWDAPPSWAVGGAESNWVERTVTIKDGASLVGKETEFWSLTYGTADASAKRTLNFYYKNFRLVDKDGKVKMNIFNNFAQYAFNNTAYGVDPSHNVGGASGNVSIVDDPLLAAPVSQDADKRALKYTLDMGSDFATAKERKSTVIFNSPSNLFPALAKGDFLEYEIYAPKEVSAAEAYMGGQVNNNGTDWKGISNTPLKEFNEVRALSWDTVTYDPSNGSRPTADLTGGFVTRRLMIPYDNTTLDGYKVYHMAFVFSSNRVYTLQNVDIYFKNIRIRDSKNQIKYNIFDGTQKAGAFVSTATDCEGMAVASQVKAKVEVSDNPKLSQLPVRSQVNNDSKNHIVATFAESDTDAKTRKAEIGLFNNAEAYTIEAGDKLVYSVAAANSVKGLGALDILFTDNTKLSDTDLTDNLGLSVKSDEDLSYYITTQYFTNPWIVRTVDLSTLAGKTVKNYIAVFNGSDALTDNILKVKFSDIQIQSVADTLTVYDGEAKGFDSAQSSLISSTQGLTGSAVQEPILFQQTRDAYMSLQYSLENADQDINRHFNISLFGFCAQSYKFEKGDRLFYSMRLSEGSGVNAFVDVQTDFTWAGLASQSVTDQNGLAANASALTTGEWTGRYFDIDKDALLSPIAHWYISVNVNGVKDFSTVKIDLADIYVLKPDGSRFDVLNGKQAKVDKGSLSIYGLPTEYRNNMNIENVVTTGYEALPSEAAPDNYIKLDYEVRGLSVGAISARSLNYSLFGAEFSDYVFRQGDKLSYKLNMSAALSGLGMLDVQVVKNESDAYHGKYIRDMVKDKYDTTRTLTLDNYGLQYATSTDISRIAVGRWATRSVEIPSEFTGYRIQHMMLSLSNESRLQAYDFTDDEQDLVRLVTVLLGDIKILHADGTETVIFDGNGVKFDAEKAIKLDEQGDLVLTATAVNKETPKDDDKKASCASCATIGFGVTPLSGGLTVVGLTAMLFAAARTGRKNKKSKCN